jgi:hypothetical protein
MEKKERIILVGIETRNALQQQQQQQQRRDRHFMELKTKQAAL